MRELGSGAWLSTVEGFFFPLVLSLSRRRRRRRRRRRSIMRVTFDYMVLMRS
jgi:hypothetical protein